MEDHGEKKDMLEYLLLKNMDFLEFVEYFKNQYLEASQC